MINKPIRKDEQMKILFGTTNESKLRSMRLV